KRTFTKHVAPILQRACQSCHRPDNIAPMPLLTYEQARPWAKSIKEKVLLRIMPPWYIDPNVGIRKFKNDGGLSDQEIATIVKWVDGGAPRGNPTDMPPPLVFDDSKWKIGEPDLIVQMLPKDLEIGGADTGQPTATNVAIAFKFHPKGYVPKFVAITELMGDDSELDLPPNTDNIRTDSYLIMSKPTRLLTFTPHMHTRGKAMCLEVIYPEKSKKRDGSRVELLNCVNNFNFNWMMAYEYASDVQPLLPAGSVLHFS